MPPPRHRFESQSSTQTLAEGLAEYFATNPGLKRQAGLSAEAQAFFRSHDAVHVVYGCGTAMADEAVVKLASIFGTTAGLQVLRGYVLHDTLDIYRNLPVLDTLRAMLLAPLLIVRTLWRCRMQQRRRWPWDGVQQHLSTPLHMLRAEFGIRVAHDRPAGDA